MTKTAIIGIGNPFRGDDGIGWAVIDALQEVVHEKVKLDKVRGEIGELLDLMSSAPTLYLIDACQAEAPLGFWQRIDALSEPLLLERAQTSTHGLSIGQAISLAKSLEQCPSKLILYAIQGENYAMSSTLSAPVAQAIPAVVQSLLNEEEIRACMKRV